MARSSPGVLRVAAILNFIADHPGQSFTLTDLVKALKLSRATCHALLTGLVEVGYLYRASDKNYVLGPKLVAIGRTADQHSSPLQIAQPEMRALADEFEVVCGAFFRDRDDIVVRDRASSVAHVGWSMPMGSRMKLSLSSGTIFFACAPPAEVDAWLDAHAPAPTPEQRAAMENGMAFVRDHGFLALAQNPRISGNPAAGQESARLFAEFPTSPISQLEDGQPYTVLSIVAPIFDARGQVAFALGLSGFTGPMRGDAIMRAGDRLRQSCDRITAFITGRPPRPFSANT